MTPKNILILGGYGSTGKLLARLILEQSDVNLVLAGRHLDKAEALTRELNAIFPGNRVRAVCIDASEPTSLRQGLNNVDMVVVASSTTHYVRQVANVAIEAKVDYLDIQYSTPKNKLLKSLESDIRQAGRCFITDGGFHPGLPAALVRYVAQFFDRLEKARVGSVIKQDWKNLQVGAETASELVELFNDFEMATYKAGEWKKTSVFSSSEYIRMDFGDAFGKQYCAPMMLEEMRHLPVLFPTIKNTGFYVGSFNWFTDWVIMPIAMVFVKINLQAAIKPMGKWMLWGLKTFSKPPYGTLLRVEATGLKDGQVESRAVTISHPDGYMFTAIPVAACLLQYLDGSIAKPGLWWQALVVEPDRFMRDMERMGIKVLI